MTLQLTDQKVRRVLECFRHNRRNDSSSNVFRRKTIEDLTEVYNQIYPPWLVGKLIGLKISEREIREPLRLLEDERYVEKHIISFTNEPHTIPVIQYSLTNAGFQYLGSLR